MTEANKDILTNTYQFFNERNIDAILALMDEHVHWPNGWEGGYVEGHEGVRDYWTRQWKELDPHVEPVGFTEIAGGCIEVAVRQVVKDLHGKLYFEGMVKHIYTIEKGLIQSMEIQNG